MNRPHAYTLIKVIWDEEFLARWGDHGNEGDELFEVNLQVSVLVEVSKELIQSFILLDFLFSKKSAWN